MRHHRWSTTVSLLAFAVVGCPSPMTPLPPEEPMIAAPEAPRIPWLAAGTPDVEPPRIPWLTDEAACPDGWGWVEVAPGVNGCDPYPTGRIEDCGPTGAHFPGEAGCRDLDSGDTEWPSDLPATNVIYVREGASGGDGTRALPFATLPEALAVATEGATIALGPGRYDAGQGAALAMYPGLFETLSHVRTRGVHIRGTSVARTTIFSTRPEVPADAPGDVAMIVAEAPDVEISDLRFESPHPAVDVNSGNATVRRVVLEGTLLGLFVEMGATGVFEDFVIRRWSGTSIVDFAVFGVGSITVRRAVLSDGPGCITTGGPGLTSVEDLTCSGASRGLATRGRRLDATRVVLVDTGVGLEANGGGEVSARWIRVIDPRGTALAGMGFGASAGMEGLITIEDLFATRASINTGDPMLGANVGGALSVSRALIVSDSCLASERGSEMSASDIICWGRSTMPEVGGVVAVAGSTIRLSRTALRDTRLYASQSTLELEDVSFRDMRSAGRAPAVRSDDSTSTLHRVSIEGASFGLTAQGGTLQATDVSVRALTPESEEFGSAGVLVIGGAVTSLTRVSIDGVEGRGVLVADGASMTAEDLVVRGFQGPPGLTGGVFVAEDAAPSSFTRVELTGSDVGAVFAGDATIADVSIHDISLGADGLAGFGLVVSAGPASAPTVTGTRVAIRDIASVGLRVGGAPAGEPVDRVALTLTDLRIERIGTAATGGAGVLARGDAMTTLTRFVVRDAASVGVMSTTGATLMLSDGLVTTSTTCTASESSLDLSTVVTDACGTAPVTWSPPER